jgi:hypothetical protein
MAALLAFSPFMVTASRTAGGLSLAVAAMAFAIALRARAGARPRASAALWSAAGLGAAIASGPSAFGGLLGLALGISVARLIWRDLGDAVRSPLPAPIWRQAAAGLAALLIISTGIGFFPGGLSGMSESLTGWLTGWSTPGPVRGLTVLLSLPIYEPMLVVFGVAGAVITLRARDSWGRLATAWAVAAILVPLVYPVRQVGDLAWAAIPLAYLSTRAIVALVENAARHWSLQAHGGLILILLALAGMALMQVSAFASGMGPAIRVADPGLSLIVAVAAFLLGGVIIVLFGMGWSWSTALEGAGLAALIGLFALSLSALWSLNFRMTAAGANELWRAQATPRTLSTVRETVERISQARTGRVDTIPVQFHDPPTPSLAWTLRQFPSAPTGELAEPAEVVVAPADADLTDLRADYIGQQVIVSERWAWDGILPPDTITWWAHREGPALQDVWLLLVRVDVATLGGLTELPEAAP